MNGTNGKQSDFPDVALVPYPVIVAATKGDPDAMKIVLQHFSGYTFGPIRIPLGLISQRLPLPVLDNVPRICDISSPVTWLMSVPGFEKAYVKDSPFAILNAFQLIRPEPFTLIVPPDAIVLSVMPVISPCTTSPPVGMAKTLCERARQMAAVRKAFRDL